MKIRTFFFYLFISLIIPVLSAESFSPFPQENFPGIKTPDEENSGISMIFPADKDEFRTNDPLITPTPTFFPSPTNTPLPTATLTPVPTSTPTVLPTPTNTNTPTDTPTPVPTFDETAFVEKLYAKITETAESYWMAQTPSATPTLPNEELITGLRMENEKDGKELVYIEGDFKKGIRGFWLDWNEVSNGEYKICVEAGFCSEPQSYRCAGEKQYYEKKASFDYPVVNITREQAEDYCSWAGMKLISVKDWRLAADALNESKGNYGNVVSHPLKNTYKRSQISGNVWEWTRDNDSTGMAVIAGGSWKTSESDIRERRLGKMNENRYDEDVGFRCVLYIY